MTLSLNTNKNSDTNDKYSIEMMQEVFHIRKRIINLINTEEFKIIVKAIKIWEVIIFCAGKDMKLIHRNLRNIMNNIVLNANNIAMVKCMDVIT